MAPVGKRRQITVTAAPAPVVSRNQSLVIAAVLVLIALAVGLTLDRTFTPTIPAAFAKCKTAAALTPRQYAAAPAMCIDPSKVYSITLNTTKGQIKFTTFANYSPQTTNNFVVLAVNGFYNGLQFWKSDSFVVQGGDPNNDGTGGPGYVLPDETEPPNEPWGGGAVGMAGNPDGSTNGSQFFMLKTDWPGLGPGRPYNRFGTLVSGIDVLGQLTTSDRIQSVQVKVS